MHFTKGGASLIPCSSHLKPVSTKTVWQLHHSDGSILLGETKALSKSPTPWRLIGLSNPLKISNIVLTLMKQSPYYQIHQFKNCSDQYDSTIYHCLYCLLQLQNISFIIPATRTLILYRKFALKKPSSSPSSCRGFRMRRAWWHFNRQRLRCGQLFKLVCSRRIWTCQCWPKSGQMIQTCSQ